MQRRKFLQFDASAAVCGLAASIRPDCCFVDSQAGPNPPVFSVVPVVGDGKWIWN